LFDIDELKPPGNYGVREAALSGGPRESLKQSILDKPEKVIHNFTPFVKIRRK